MPNGIEGLDDLMAKFGKKAIKVVDANMEKAVGNAMQIVRTEARLMCPVNHGELRRSIKAVVKREDDCIEGTCYTNSKYAKYVELGTGPAGEADHAGISPTVNPVYTQSPWWVHESAFESQSDAERYGWFFIDTPEGRFYRISGQPAQPFMYPALKNNEERVTKRISDVLSAKIREEFG